MNGIEVDDWYDIFCKIADLQDELWEMYNADRHEADYNGRYLNWGEVHAIALEVFFGMEIESERSEQ